jgi:hypothetical protein
MVIHILFRNIDNFKLERAINLQIYWKYIIPYFKQVGKQNNVYLKLTQFYTILFPYLSLFFTLLLKETLIKYL